MESRFVVRINLELVRRNLSQADRKAWTLLEVEDWLKKAGFSPREDGLWVVREKDMGQLDPSEVTIERDESEG